MLQSHLQNGCEIFSMSASQKVNLSNFVTLFIYFLLLVHNALLITVT